MNVLDFAHSYVWDVGVYKRGTGKKMSKQAKGEVEIDYCLFLEQNGNSFVNCTMHISSSF